MSSQRIKHFYYDGHPYTVLNPRDMDSLPRAPIKDPEREGLLCPDMHSALWATERCPEIAYLPRNCMIPRCHFFGPISIDIRTVPVKETPEGYTLEDRILNMWRSIEEDILHVTELLLRRETSSIEAKFPSDPFWGAPKEYTYTQIHLTAGSVRAAVQRARDAFFFLFARCTLAIALCIGPGDDKQVVKDKYPSWASYLIEQGVSRELVHSLYTSKIADLSPDFPRLGAFVDPFGGTRWMNHVPCMIRANLPVYIYWHDGPGFAKAVKRHPFLQRYLPPIIKGVPGGLRRLQEVPVSPGGKGDKESGLRLYKHFTWTSLPEAKVQVYEDEVSQTATPRSPTSPTQEETVFFGPNNSLLMRIGPVMTHNAESWPRKQVPTEPLVWDRCPEDLEERFDRGGREVGRARHIPQERRRSASPPIRSRPQTQH